MSVVAIHAHDVGKQYLLGGYGGPRYATLRDALAAAVTARSGRSNGTRGRAQRDRIWALNGVSFTVEEGEVVGLIGRNGAGKSTLLKILSRVTEPTTGRVELRGRVGSLLEVGTGFHAELTGRENVFLSGAILGMARADIGRRFDAIAEFSGVERFLDTPVKYYSSGMQARLGFAVAAHLEPDILVVDEVLAVGDAEFQKRCLGKMGNVAREGRTVLFVSHNMAAVNQLCPRSILLDEGHIVMDGPTSTVVPTYLASASEGSPVRTWADGERAPGDELLRLRSVRVISEDRVSGEVAIDQPLTVEVEFSCTGVIGGQVSTELLIEDGSGTVVLQSGSRPRASSLPLPDFAAPLTAGIHRHACTFPANFFNDELYYVTVIVVTRAPGLERARADQAVSFRVFDTGAMRDPGVAGKWRGVVRPRFAWERDRRDE